MKFYICKVILQFLQISLQEELKEDKDEPSGHKEAGDPSLRPSLAAA